MAFFAFGLQPRFQDSDSVDRALGSIAGISTGLSAASLIIAASIGAAVGAAEKFGDVAVDANLARTFDNLFYGVLGLGVALPAGALMAAVAAQIRRRGILSSWLFWACIVGIIGMLTSLAFLPFVLFPLWLIAVGIVLMRSVDPAPSRSS